MDSPQSLVSRRLALLVQHAFPHALALVGLTSQERRAMSTALAQRLYCESQTRVRKSAISYGGCGQCAVCQRVSEGAFYAVALMTPPEGKTFFERAQIDALLHELSLTSLNGLPRLCILDPLEALTPLIQNVLLKTIEEPQLHSHFLFLGSHARQLLPTLRSRLTLLSCPPAVENGEPPSWNEALGQFLHDRNPYAFLDVCFPKNKETKECEHQWWSWMETKCLEITPWEALLQNPALLEAQVKGADLFILAQKRQKTTGFDRASMELWLLHWQNALLSAPSV